MNEIGIKIFQILISKINHLKIDANEPEMKYFSTLISDFLLKPIIEIAKSLSINERIFNELILLLYCIIHKSSSFFFLLYTKTLSYNPILGILKLKKKGRHPINHYLKA